MTTKTSSRANKDTNWNGGSRIKFIKLFDKHTLNGVATKSGHHMEPTAGVE